MTFHCAWQSPYYTDSERAAVADKLADARLTCVRIDADWSAIEDTRKGAREPGYLGALDRCVELSKQRGFSVLVNL